LPIQPLRILPRSLLILGALALLPSCNGTGGYSHVAVNIPPPTGSTPPACTPVACADNNTTSTCPASTHCFNGFCIDESCQQICLQANGTQGVIPDDGGSTMVKPCQVIACGSNYCTGSHAACCGNSCVNTNTDSNNCGGCGIACVAPSTCAGGSCNCAGNTCFPWQSCCALTCTDPYWDNNNCGGCGIACGNGKVCDFGSCLQGCYIGGQTYWPGTWDPLGTCGYCVPAISTTAWSPALDGQYCSVMGGNVCVGGVCKAGCLVSYLPTQVSQVPALEAPGTINNGCFICNPAIWPDGLCYHPPLNTPNCVDPQFYPFASAGIAGGVGGDGRFWVAGGFNWTGPGDTFLVSNQAWGFDPINNNWLQGPNLTLGREEAAGAADPVSGQIFLFGGLDNTGTSLASAETFDPGPPATPWTSLPSPLSEPRHMAAAVYVADAGLIYVFGGENGWSGTPVDTVETYKTTAPYTHTVLPAPSMAGLLPANPLLTGPTGQPTLIASSAIDNSNVDGQVYLIGGYYPYSTYGFGFSFGGSPHNAVWSYDVANNAWAWSPALAAAQAWAGTVMIPGDIVYEVTGDNGFGPSVDTQTTTLSTGGFWSSTFNQPLYFREGGMAFYSPAPDNRLYVIGGEEWGWANPVVETFVLTPGYGVWLPQYPEY